MAIAIGAVLALVILTDAIRTTINLSAQRGPIARAVLWLGRAVVRRLPRRLRSGAGVVLTMMVVASWTFGLWLAWTIALLDPAITVIDTSTGLERTGWDVVYVAGYAIFTLGTGDLATTNAMGRLVTVLAAGTGLFTVTMEVTYLVSLTTAAATERRTARQVYALGHDVTQILRRSWDGASFRAIEPLLLDLASDLGAVAEEHRTFPVLHDVVPSQRALALGPSLLALTDAIEVMLAVGPDRGGIGRLPYAQVVEAVDALLEGLPEDTERDDPPEPPDPPDLRLVLDEFGLGSVGPVPVSEERARRRAALFGLATEEGWERAAVDAVQPVEPA